MRLEAVNRRHPPSIPTTSPQGLVFTQITIDGVSDAWISLMFARWENHYRPAFAEISGVTTESIISDSMGDVRRLRNDIIHHQGIATKKNAGKCEVLDPINTGEQIVLTPDDIKMLLRNLRVGLKDGRVLKNEATN